MNYIKKFMNDNNIKKGEVFKLIMKEGLKDIDCYIKDGKLYKTINPYSALPSVYLVGLLRGDYIVKKKTNESFYPKKGEWYWFYGVRSKCAVKTINDWLLTDMVFINKGFAFRTKEEAEENKQVVIDFYTKELDKYNKLIESEG